VQLLEKIWFIEPDNQLSMKGKEWSIRDFHWSNDTQEIGLHGYLSNDLQKRLSLRIADFNLATLNSIIQRKLDGNVNATVLVNDVYHNASLQNEITIRNLKVDDFLVGDVTGNNT